MERREFEESWRKAFEDAAFTPSDSVWTNIELELEREKAGQLKRRLVFYQLLAAASLVFALTIGLGMYFMDREQPRDLADRRVENRRNGTIRAIDGSTAARNQSSATAALEQKSAHDALSSEAGRLSASKPEEKVTDKSADDQTLPDNTPLSGNINSSSHSAIESESIATSHNNSGITISEEMSRTPQVNDIDAVFAPFPQRKLPVLVNEPKPSLASASRTAQPDPDPVTAMMNKLAERERQLREEEETKEEAETKGREERLWTSVGFAAGSFNSVNSGAPALVHAAYANTSSLASASIANQETKASGTTYSMGLNVGTKLAKRWVLQGGVNYLAQNSAYKQNSLIVNQDFTQFTAANINDVEKMMSMGEEEAIVSTQPHNVNNSVRYLSIPMQAGFLVVDKAVGLQLNAGVATDLFLQNTITATANGERMNQSKIGIGEESAFRPVNLSGLVGTEVSYKFSKHYRVALNPGVKYPFNSIYRSSEFKANRLSFDVGLRFRYIFH